MGRWTTLRSPACWTAGFGAWPRRASTGMRRSGTAAPRTASPMGSGPTTACRLGCTRWWSRRSPILPPPGRWCAWAAGSTGYPHDKHRGHPSLEWAQSARWGLPASQRPDRQGKLTGGSPWNVWACGSVDRGTALPRAVIVLIHPVVGLVDPAEPHDLSAAFVQPEGQHDTAVKGADGAGRDVQHLLGRRTPATARRL